MHGLICSVGILCHVQEVDLERGHLSGCMSSEDVPHVPGGPVRTFWEGEVLDNRNATFVTPKWGADVAVDYKHWSKFPAFAALQLEVKGRRGRYEPSLSWVHLRLHYDGLSSNRPEDVPSAACNL